LIAPFALIVGSVDYSFASENTTYMFSASFSYDFADTTVLNCIANASRILSRYELDRNQYTESDESGKRAVIFGWSEDAKSTIAIECDSENNTSQLNYATYTDSHEKSLEIYNKIESDDW
jgi:cell division septum initiation protein DivIVA